MSGTPYSLLLTNTELVFVNLLRSPKIDSQPGGPVRQPYLSYRCDNPLCRTGPTVYIVRRNQSIPWNRFPGSINVYKYGLCIASANLLIPMIGEVLWEPKRRRAWASHTKYLYSIYTVEHHSGCPLVGIGTPPPL